MLYAIYVRWSLFYLVGEGNKINSFCHWNEKITNVFNNSGYEAAKPLFIVKLERIKNKFAGLKSGLLQ